jgi:hypothetical protein
MPSLAPTLVACQGQARGSCYGGWPTTSLEAHQVLLLHLSSVSVQFTYVQFAKVAQQDCNFVIQSKCRVSATTPEPTRMPFRGGPAF